MSNFPVKIEGNFKKAWITTYTDLLFPPASVSWGFASFKWTL